MSFKFDSTIVFESERCPGVTFTLYVVTPRRRKEFYALADEFDRRLIDRFGAIDAVVARGHAEQGMLQELEILARECHLIRLQRDLAGIQLWCQRIDGLAVDDSPVDDVAEVLDVGPEELAEEIGLKIRDMLGNKSAPKAPVANADNGQQSPAGLKKLSLVTAPPPASVN